MGRTANRVAGVVLMAISLVPLLYSLYKLIVDGLIELLYWMGFSGIKFLVVWGIALIVGVLLLVGGLVIFMRE